MGCADFESIPIVDISGLINILDETTYMVEDEGVVQVVKQLDQACIDSGFFYLKGHGIPDSLIRDVRSIARKFFDSSYEEKLKIKLSAASGYRGYQYVGENFTKGIPDKQEAIDCYREVKDGMYSVLGDLVRGKNQWPSNPPDFNKTMEEYINLCTDVSKRVMRGISLALTGSAVEFEGDIAGDPFWVTRIIGYPAITSENGHHMPTNDIGCGAHTDYGLLTLINQDEDITALQVRNLSGEWISAPPIPGTFVCNIGDMLQILSNGIYKSTLHRVTNNSPKYRVCVAYFYEPNYEASIEPLNVCVETTGGKRKKLEGAVYGKHLVNKILNNFRKCSTL